MVELAFGLAALVTFTGLSIYILQAGCYNHQLSDILFWVQMFALVGAVTAAFVSLYCFFEKHLAPRQGLTSCLFFTTLVAVACLNCVGAYLTIGCICRCAISPFHWNEITYADLTIFILEILGSIFLLLVILTASITQHIS